MGDGWTGINLDAVKSQLDNFKSVMDEIANNYQTAFSLFNEELYRTWASEKAIAYNAHIKNLATLGLDIGRCAWDVLYSASRAADFMAQHNGASFSYDVGTRPSGEGDAKMLEDVKDGITGMNVVLAKMSVDAFKESTTSLIERLIEVPTDFSLLDPDGTLQTEYKRMVNQLILLISNAVSSAVNDAKAAFETEELNVMLGKQQAESQLTA